QRSRAHGPLLAQSQELGTCPKGRDQRRLEPVSESAGGDLAPGTTPTVRFPCHQGHQRPCLRCPAPPAQTTGPARKTQRPARSAEQGPTARPETLWQNQERTGPLHLEAAASDRHSAREPRWPTTIPAQPDVRLSAGAANPATFRAPG